jgi:DNA-binding IclR family transcriptional regulator
VLLATRSQADLRRYLNRLKPQRLTIRTETNKHRLADAIGAARETGVAQTMDQATDGVTGTASAILDATGIAIGALIVAAPSSRLQGRRDELALLVRQEAAAISRSLGYRAAARTPRT